MHEKDMGLLLNCIHLDKIPRIDLKNKETKTKEKIYEFYYYYCYNKFIIIITMLSLQQLQ